MASSDNIVPCSKCTRGSDVRHAAKQWCHDCEAVLCIYCLQRDGDIHDTHKKVEIEEYLKIPPMIRFAESRCPEHKLKYTSFCSSHDLPLCKRCVQSSHMKCDGIHDLEKVLNNESTSTEFESAYNNVNSTLFELLKVIELTRSNIESFEKKCTSIEKLIRKTSHDIKKHIDALTRSMLEEIDNKKSTTLDTMEDVLEKSKQKAKLLKDFVDNSIVIKTSASKFQKFIGTRMITELVYEDTVFLESLSKEGKLDKIDINYTKDNTIDTLSNIRAIGVLKTETIPVNKTRITTGDKTTAQAETTNPLPKEVKFSKKYSLVPANYAGLCSLSNGRMIFTDYNSDSLCVYSEEGKLSATFNLEGKDAFDVCEFDENFVAISGGRSGLSIFNVVNSTMTLERNIEDSSWLFGVAGTRDKIFACAEKNGIKCLNMKTHEWSLEVEDKHVSEDSYVAVYNGLVVYTIPKDNKVVIYNSQFRTRKEFKDMHLLRSPKGVAVDEQMNIFVAGSDSYNVLVISADCNSYRQILGRTDCVSEPVSLHYCRKTNHLIVLDVNSCVKFYSITH